VDVALAPLQLELLRSALRLDVLQEGLPGEKLCGTHSGGPGCCRALFAAHLLEMLRGAAQRRLSAHAPSDGRGELLLGELLLALPYSTDAFQAEAKRGTVHVLFIGRPGAFFRPAGR
jgi:hypothetical protein